MKIVIKFEASVETKDIEKIIDIMIPSDISNETNTYDAYARGYGQAFNDLAQEMISTFNYGANNVNQIIQRLNDKHRAKVEEG